MTDLLSELRQSPVQRDREVAELLHSLRPAAGSRPRASEVLAAFLAERGSGMTAATELREPTEGSTLLVVLGSAPEPGPARRRRVLTGVWAQAAVAAAVALVAVAIATGGPSRDVVVRPTDSSTTVAPATTTPADRADPTPRRHHSVAPGAGSRPHRQRTHPSVASDGTSDHTASVRTSTPAVGGEQAGRDAGDQVEEPGDDHGDETASGTGGGGETSDDGAATTESGETSDGGGGESGETPDAVDD
jgi:uncharacterized membrane protein YgcG